MQLLPLLVPFPRQRKGICSSWMVRPRRFVWEGPPSWDRCNHQAVTTESRIISCKPEGCCLTRDVWLGSKKPHCPGSLWLGHLPPRSVPVSMQIHWGRSHSAVFLSKEIKAPEHYHRQVMPATPACSEELFRQLCRVGQPAGEGLPCSAPTARTTASSGLLPNHHVPKEPHALTSFFLLHSNLKEHIYSRHYCRVENELSAVLSVNLFLPLQESLPGFSLKCSIWAHQWLSCVWWLIPVFCQGSL